MESYSITVGELIGYMEYVTKDNTISTVGYKKDTKIYYIDDCVSRIRNNARDDILLLVFKEYGKYKTAEDILMFLTECMDDKSANISKDTTVYIGTSYTNKAKQAKDIVGQPDTGLLFISQ